MRWIRWAGFLAVAVGVVAGLVGATPSPACACSCVPSTVRSSFERADVVFAGELVKRDEASDHQKATLVFEVSTVYKGKVAARQEIVTHASGATCGLELTGRGPHLVFGNTAAADYEPAPAEGQYVSGLCGGSRTFDQAVRTELRPLARATGPEPVKAGPAGPNVAVSPAEVGEPAGWWSSAATVAAAVLLAAAAVGAVGTIAWRRRRKS